MLHPKKIPERVRIDHFNRLLQHRKHQWIIGEYCHLIDHVDLLLDPFFDTFQDETQEGQIQLVTAVAKAFLHDEETTKLSDS